MRFLHTSDWHLGQRLQTNERLAEHQKALTWLIQTIDKQQIECLIIAGDIFDIANPPSSAQQLYYTFLTNLLKTSCQHVVIIGGNHDSPSLLNAPKQLLSMLNIHVVGMATERMEDQIIELKDQHGNLVAVIAAVPFLRDKDLKNSVSGETATDRTVAIRQALRKHYEDIGEKVAPYRQFNIPILTTGHLYLKEVGFQEGRNNIYIGDCANMETTHFPEVFDYVALGHIHRAYALGKIHYSGSLIPLSFSETKDEKIVKIVEVTANHLNVQDVAVPLYRRLKTVKKNYESIFDRLLKLHEKYSNELPVWVDVLITDDKYVPNAEFELRHFVETRKLNLELLHIRTTYQPLDMELEEDLTSLKDLEVISIFQRKCQSEGLSENEIEEMTSTFKELQSWMQEREKDGEV